MTVHQALEFFEVVPAIREKLQTLYDVGLGYIRLGQPGDDPLRRRGPAIKLSKELSRRATGRTLYLLDEPTTGLHFDDIKKLLSVLNRLVDQGNTVVVIEHNLDVIKTADWVLDLGPEGGTTAEDRRRGAAGGRSRGRRSRGRGRSCAVFSPCPAGRRGVTAPRLLTDPSAATSRWAKALELLEPVLDEVQLGHFGGSVSSLLRNQEESAVRRDVVRRVSDPSRWRRTRRAPSESRRTDPGRGDIHFQQSGAVEIPVKQLSPVCPPTAALSHPGWKSSAFCCQLE